MPTLWSEQWYARRCMMCGWIARKNEWDDTPAMTHCAICGIELERLECGSCGAPLVIRQDMFGGGRATEFCAFCGHDNAPPRERKMRERPKAKQADANHMKLAPYVKRNDGDDDKDDRKPVKRRWFKWW